MLTRIEIDGFKSFQDFSMDFAPFQVVIGPNGAGKSNLFDALRLLSQLADGTINDAFRALRDRGLPAELFTAFTDGRSAICMSFVVELLVDRTIQDSLGLKADLQYRRLRYKLTIRQQNTDDAPGRLVIAHESLTSIPLEEDTWLGQGVSIAIGNGKTNGGSAPGATAPTRSFIRTDPELSPAVGDGDEDCTTYSSDVLIRLGSVEGSDGPLGVADLMRQTLLSTVGTAEFPEAYAAREEMRSWRFLLNLDPRALRSASPVLSDAQLNAEGLGLAAVLARLQAEDLYFLSDVSRELASLVPGIRGISVVRDNSTGEYRLRATTDDDRSLSVRQLSDGTLRLLALVTLNNDPEQHGVLCVEEPENGIPPFRLKGLVELLRSLATDLTDTQQADRPLRQVIVNTHSPALVGQLVPLLIGAPGQRSGLAFAHLVTRVAPGSGRPPIRVSRFVPVTTDQQLQHELEIGDGETAYTLARVQEYLRSVNAVQAADLLQGANVR